MKKNQPEVSGREGMMERILTAEEQNIVLSYFNTDVIAVCKAAASSYGARPRDWLGEKKKHEILIDIYDALLLSRDPQPRLFYLMCVPPRQYERVIIFERIIKASTFVRQCAVIRELENAALAHRSKERFDHALFLPIELELANSLNVVQLYSI